MMTIWSISGIVLAYRNANSSYLQRAVVPSARLTDLAVPSTLISLPTVRMSSAAKAWPSGTHATKACWDTNLGG